MLKNPSSQKYKMPPWFPDHPAIYDIQRTYLENLEKGPFFKGNLPERAFPEPHKWIDFLGHKVASPLGIPAGPLLSSNWISFAAKMGFDILTYKTIRSVAHPAHPLPNMIFVDTKGDVLKDMPEIPAVRVKTPPASISELAVTNSFGNPSMTPQFLMEDIARANAALAPGQLLIVSVYGFAHDGIDALTDFTHAARFAKEAGAKVIEANLSCPNLSGGEGSLYQNPELVFSLTKRLAEAIAPIPLVLKVGLFSSDAQCEQILIAAAKAGAKAVCGINTIKMRALSPDGTAALGNERLACGICGGPIRKAALLFIRQAAKIIQKNRLDLALMSTGGVTLPEHFQDLLGAGADIAMTATGMMWDPYLAMRYHQGESA